MVNISLGTRIHLSHVKDVLFTLFITILCTTILIMPDSSSSGISRGLGFCAGMLIPSLFPFILISSLVVNSGISYKIGKIISPVTRFLFFLPGYTGATIFLSLIGGYPSGARGISSLSEQGLINERQANRMLYFTVASGPGFIIGVVGSKLFHNSIIGIILMISQVSASILIGIISGVIARRNEVFFEKNEDKSTSYPKYSTALVDSCIDATDSMINMCAFVILFCGIMSIVKDTGLNNIITSSMFPLKIPLCYSENAVSSLLEVTGGCIDSISMSVPPEFISFITGWAGICVHMQILSILNKINVSYIRFAIYRVLNGILSMIISHILLTNICLTSTVFSTVEFPPSASISSNIIGSIALILVCTNFVLSVLSSNYKSKPIKFKTPNN